MDITQNRTYSSIALISFVLILSFLVTGFIVSEKFEYLIFALAILLLILVIRSNIFSISIILLTFPITNTIYHFIPVINHSSIELLPEMLSGLLLAKVIIYRLLARKKIRTFGLSVILPVLGITLFSGFINNFGYASILAFIRLFLRYYLLFLAIINMNLSEKHEKLIIRLIIFIFIIQIPLAVWKLFLGLDEETLFGLNGTSITTTVTLTAIAFIISAHLINKPSKLNFLLAIGFIGFGIIGGKRAIPFLLPIVFIFMAWLFRKELRSLFKYAVISIPILLITFYLMLRLLPSLNPQGKVWGEFNPGYALEYAQLYTTGNTNELETTGGRWQTSQRVYEHLIDKGVLGLGLGFGPGAILDSRFQGISREHMLRSKFGIHYGVTGINWLGLQIGYVGALFYLAFFWFVLQKTKIYFYNETDRFRKALAGGFVTFSFIILFISIVYNPIFLHDSVSAIYFCLAGIMVARSETISN